MSISQLSCTDKSSPSRQVINWEENYSLAVQRAFTELGQTALEKQKAELQLLEDLRLSKCQEKEAVQRRKAAEVVNAQDLKQQMALRRERIYRDRLEEQLPGIALNYSGYPNLPETPEHTRKLLKTERQRELKAVLDVQWERQLAARRDEKELELLRERERLDKAQREIKALATEKAQKRVRDREELVKAWGEMEKAKAIRERIESLQLKGVNPRMEPISAFLIRAGGLSTVLADIQPAASIEVESKVLSEVQTKPLEPENAQDQHLPEGNTSVQLPVPSDPSTAVVLQSQSFDVKSQVVRPPVIQQYQAHDTTHHSHSKVLRPGLQTLGIARYSSQRASPHVSQDTLRSNGWTFATHQEVAKAAPKSGRSLSQVAQPAVYVVRKYEHKRLGSVLAQTGAHMLQ